MGLRETKTIDEFELLRRRARGAGRADTQEQQQNLKRRFASLGGLESGAFIKQQQVAQQRGQEALGERLGTIDIAEAKENQRQKELDQARTFAAEQAGLSRGFQSEEAQKQRGFVGEQAELGRGFQSEEALKNREFSSEEASLGRAFQGSMLDRTQLWQSAESQLARDFAGDQHGLDLAMQQQSINNSFSIATQQLGIQNQQMEDAMLLGLKALDLDEEKMNNAKELGIAQLELNSTQLANAMEMGLRAQNFSEGQAKAAAKMAKDEMDINNKTIAFNKLASIINLPSGEREQFSNMIAETDPELSEAINKISSSFDLGNFDFTPPEKEGGLFGPGGGI